MANEQYTFKYGNGNIKFQLDSAQVIGELKMEEFPVLVDPVAAIKKAIRNPIDSKPLREIVKPGQTVAFIVNDSTRIAHSDVFMPILLDELNSVGVKDEDMIIVFALGTHRMMTEEEMAKEVGIGVAKRVKMYNNDFRNQSQYKFFGTTSHGTPVWFNKLVAEVDHIICTGNIVHHFFSGFGGGRKAMLPGVSYYETVRKNHSMMFDSNAVIGKLEGNPIYRKVV